LFWGEQIADKFGIIFNYSESPVRYLTGAIINGKNYGTIVGVKNYKSSLPNKVSLSNNYPNPFNPATTINYQIPKASNVQIKVYDVLGKEVAELVNEKKEPGRYNVQFDASNLPSGLYFYRMQAGKFSEVRKMLLMK